MAFGFVYYFVLVMMHLVERGYSVEVFVKQKGRPNPIKMHGKKPVAIKDVRRFIQVETGRMPNQIFMNEHKMADEVELAKSPLLKLPRLTFEYDVSNTVIIPCSLAFIEAEGQYRETVEISLKVDIGVVTSFECAIAQINRFRKRIPAHARVLFVFKNLQNEHIIMTKADYEMGCNAFTVESLESMPAEKRYYSGIKSRDLLKRELIPNDAADAQILVDMLGMKITWSDILIWYPAKTQKAYDDDFFILVLDMSKHGALHFQRVKYNPKVARIWDRYYGQQQPQHVQEVMHEIKKKGQEESTSVAPVSKCCSVQ